MDDLKRILRPLLDPEAYLNLPDLEPEVPVSMSSAAELDAKTLVPLWWPTPAILFWMHLRASLPAGVHHLPSNEKLQATLSTLRHMRVAVEKGTDIFPF